MELTPTIESTPQEHQMTKSTTSATSPHNDTLRRVLWFNPLVITTLEPSVVVEPYPFPYVEIALARVPLRDLQTYMTEIMNEMGENHHVLIQSYVKL
jgi:hypothetical protein